jgi:hypothetical protein
LAFAAKPLAAPRAPRMTWLWGLVAASALLWPDRIASPFDGVPLDRAVEVVFIGAVFPALWVFHPRFLATRFARAAIVALVIWRAFTAMALVQDGWCVRFEPSRPYAKDAKGAPHAWDLRADWRADDPACSAIMTRSYRTYREFPAWFFNLPPPNESWPVPEDLPPEATTGLEVRGFVTTSTPGVLDVDLGPGLNATLAVDGRVAAPPVSLEPGVHQVVVSGTMKGRRWWLVPQWNGDDLWSSVTATVQRPSTTTLTWRRWARWIPLAITASFLAAWIVSALARVGSIAVLAWMVGTSLVIARLLTHDQVMAARWVIALLAAAAFVPVPPRLRNASGAFLLVGVPWTAFIATYTLPAIGVWILYDWGNDYWMFQRYGYRIVMQGYWLEGGTPTFYFQPFYRWISGVLHAIFGDSSAGEFYWEGACLLAGAMLSFRVTRPFAGFRWGVVAAVAPLAVFSLSTASDLIGRGLSEISSAGLLSMAALCAMRGRGRSTAAAIGAGVLATLAFYTRLNNLLMAFGVAVFALPPWLRVRALARPLAWWRHVSWRTLMIVPAVIGLGLLGFAWRTWYYTGVFSVFHGTQRHIVAIWQPGMPLRTILYWMGYNMMVVLSVNDPPRFDIFASPVLVGAIVAVLSIARLPRLRELPAAAVLFFFAAIAGSFIARGWAYAPRFSMHVMPITCALAVCGVASVLRRRNSELRTQN